MLNKAYFFVSEVLVNYIKMIAEQRKNYDSYDKINLLYNILA